MDKEPDFFGGVLKIALGIVLGGVILWVAAEYYMRYRINQVATAVEQVTGEIIMSFEEAQRRNTEAQAARQRAAAEQRRLDEMRRAAAIQAAADRERASARLAAEKEAAWNRFYQPSKECLRETSVECGNAYIRARRDFERRYAAGEF